MLADPRLLGVGIHRARRAEAHGDQPRLDIACADRAHHVVAATTGDQRVWVKAQQSGNFRTQYAHRFLGLQQLWKCLAQTTARVDVREQWQVPLASAHVEIAGARRVAKLGAAAAGQPIVEVVVGQQHLVDPLEQIRVLLLGPQQLGHGITWGDDQAKALQ